MGEGGVFFESIAPPSSNGNRSVSAALVIAAFVTFMLQGREKTAIDKLADAECQSTMNQGQFCESNLHS